MLIGEIKMHCSCAKSLIEGDKPLVHVGAGNLRLYADSRKCERLEGHICRNSSQRTRLAVGILGWWREGYLARSRPLPWNSRPKVPFPQVYRVRTRKLVVERLPARPRQVPPFKEPLKVGAGVRDAIAAGGAVELVA